MKLIIYSHEEHDMMAHGAVICSSDYMDSRESRGAILCTQEELDQYYLMHWRTKGSRNGFRRYQDKQGRLTPEGYKHYAEMYGWGKKLKKAERLQDRADEKEERAKSKAIAADEALLKSHKADLKNERRSTARRQRKADLMKTRKEEADAAAAIARTDARKAQDKATNYADKLQRKEDKMAKYVDETGMLNEKALEKYTYTTGVPGERKMSLVGRMKFGNEYSKKFEEEYAREQKSKRDEEGRRDLEIANKRINEFNEIPEGRHASDLTLEHHQKATLDQVFRTVERMRNDEVNVDPKRRDEIESWLNKQIESEKAGIRDLIDNQTDKLDSMSAKERAKTGTRILEELAASPRSYRTDDPEYTRLDEGLQKKLINMVYDKSGSINAGDYKSGTNARKAQDKVDEITIKKNERERVIKERMNYRDERDAEKLEEALGKDSTWKELDQKQYLGEQDVMGAILDDLGFPDTTRNRSILFMYGWYD